MKNIKSEINELISLTSKYYDELNNSNEIDLAKFNMIGKRKVCMLVHAFATYLRWYYIWNNLKNVPITLNLECLFNYKTNIINLKTINLIDISYSYFRYLVSRVEIWAKKYNHHYEHRSKEFISKKIFEDEYKKIWNNSYLPINEQTVAYNNLINNITYTLETIE